MKILSSLFGLALLIVAVVFAISNRQTVDISLSPFDLTVSAPLYFVTLGCFCTGLLLGALIVWLSLLPHRFAARRLHTDINALHDKLNTLQASMTVATREENKDASPLPRRRLWARARDFGSDTGL